MLNKKIASELAVGIVLLIALAVGGIFWMENKNPAIENQQLVIETPSLPHKVDEEKKNEVACTMEAKLCEDGSYVGRTGPNCEFTECPVLSNVSSEKAYENNEYGFKFKYPSDFSVKENSDFEKLPYLLLSLEISNDNSQANNNVIKVYVSEKAQLNQGEEVMFAGKKGKVKFLESDEGIRYKVIEVLYNNLYYGVQVMFDKNTDSITNDADLLIAAFELTK